MKISGMGRRQWLRLFRRIPSITRKCGGNWRRAWRQCAKYGKRFKIVRNGVPEAVLLSAAEWDQILETLSILTSAEMMEQLIRSEKDIIAGKVQPLDNAFKDLLAEG